MSDAKKYRSAMRAKAHRLAGGESGAIDASDFKGEEGGQGYLHADTKTGMRPVSPRQYRRGGKVLGVGGQEARHHQGRAKRKGGGGAGGIESEQFANRDYKKINATRPKGKDHIGGMKEGGRTAKMGGGPLGGFNAVSDPGVAAAVGNAMQNRAGVDPSRMTFGNTGRSLIKRGGKVEHPYGHEDKQLAEKLVEHHTPRKNRASGGRAGKGKTNINIIIGAPRHEEQPQGAPPGGPPPPARPVPTPTPMPPPAGGAGAPPMPGMPPGGAPPMPPMRASGGVVADGKCAEAGKYPIKHASAGGKGRLEKKAAYGLPTPPAKSV